MSVITMMPTKESGNLYTHLLYRALESVGLRYLEIPYSNIYLLRNRPGDSFHYLHFHWPEVFFWIRPKQPHRLFGLKDYLRLKVFWILAKLRGYRIVWTVHEVDVHDVENQTWLQTLSRRVLWRYADLVFAHSDEVMEEAVRRWGPKTHAHTLPHGSYEGAYPSDMSRSAARQRLGIPQDAFAFVFLGNIRPYKGVDVLVEAFRSLQVDHTHARLIVAGRTHSQEFAEEVRSRVADHASILLHLEFVPDEDVQMYLRAADCYVAPYRSIETCGVVYLAMAFELPIIIKREGNVRDFDAHRIGILMKDASETEAAMRKILQMSADELEHLRSEAREASRMYSWDRLSSRYRAAFDQFERDDVG